MRAEQRTCRLCSKRDWSRHDDGARLFKYSVRSYAHPRCLVLRRGMNGALAVIPQHRHEAFRDEYELAVLDDPWVEAIAADAARSSG